MSDNHYNFISITSDIFHNVYGLILKLYQLFLEQLHETRYVKADMPSSLLFYRDNNGNDYYEYLLYPKFTFCVSLFLYWHKYFCYFKH
jgi:hypothetical protein